MARRSVVVVFTFLGVACLVSLFGFVALYILLGTGPTLPATATLTLNVSGDLAEASPTDVLGFVRSPRTPTVRGLVDSLKKAKADTRIKGIFLEFTGLTTPYWGKLQELRDAVADVRSSGKPVYAYLAYGSDRDYYVASAADRVFLMPSSPLDFAGVATYQVFLRGALDKVGVVADLRHVGDFKTAPNTFTEKGYTPTHREMDASLNRDLLSQVVAGVASGRRRAEAGIRALVDDGPFLPAEAKRVGLVDDVLYEDEARHVLREAAGVTTTRDISWVDYASVSLESVGLNRGPRIGVIVAAGTIVDGRSGYDPLNGATVGSETLIEAIRAAAADASLRALILRIDSPGGSAVASDAIWRELMVAKAARPDRPIVASMSDLAASGGYFVAMPAHAIVAQPLTLTGSIGIFGGKFVSGGVYEKLGAATDAESIGKHAEMNSPLRGYNADEGRKIDEQLRAFYTDFVKKAAQSRSTTPEQIEVVAQGRVWTGKQAKDNGLVDELGGLDVAVALAKTRAGIQEEGAQLVTFPAPKSFYQVLSESLSGEVSARAASAWLVANLSEEERTALRAVRGPFSAFRRGEALALMPWTLVR